MLWRALERAAGYRNNTWHAEQRREITTTRLMGNREPDEIRFLKPAAPQYAAALRIIVSGQTAPDKETDRRVADLLDFVQARPLVLEPVLGAFTGGRLVCACASVESPGRAALVYLPPNRLVRRQNSAMAPLLRAVQEQAWARSLAFVQALVPPAASSLEEALSLAGFRFLAELMYQERPVDAPSGSANVRKDLTFIPYSRDTHELFIDALNLTYVGSLDCPALTGLRDTEDGLAAHKAAGVHDPALWFVAQDGSRPVGVILLSQVLRRPALEVVYMGVAPDARGRGVGDALLGQAADECIRRGATHVTLAVDSKNHPAMRLYERWGFVEAARRRAWFTTDPNAKR